MKQIQNANDEARAGLLVLGPRISGLLRDLAFGPGAALRDLEFPHLSSEVFPSSCFSWLSGPGLALSFLVGGTALAQQTGNTVGLTFHAPDAFPGYTLFSPQASTNVYLINIQGELVNRWRTGFPPGHAAYLLENGHLFRAAQDNNPAFNAGGQGGRVEEYDWEGRLVWSFNYSTSQHRQHHDAIKLPNGNVVMIAWELKTYAEAIAAGRHPSLLTQGALWPDHLVEIQPSGPTGGTVVWEWHAWHHLIQDVDLTKANYGTVGDHPELIDLNYPPRGAADWLHMNGLDFNPALDQIIVSARSFDEIWVIDHSTTTAEAAGHSGGRSGKGGDLLYRWGNPRAYRRGTAAAQKLFGQHHPTWIRPGLPGEGHLLIFNNGEGRPGGNYSSIEEIIPPMDTNRHYTLTPGSAFGPASAAWSYNATPPASFYAALISGCQRLPNGNTLICDGPRGVFFEVTASGALAWRYVCPVTASGLLAQGASAPVQNHVFRSPRYALDYPGLAGRDLTPHGTVERYPGAPFQIVSVVADGAAVRLSWNSVADQSYRVQHQPNLLSAPWTTISTNTALGTRTTFTDTDPTRLDRRTGLYRVARP